MLGAVSLLRLGGSEEGATSFELKIDWEERKTRKQRMSSPSDFKRRGCHGGELGGNGEDAVEFSVGKWRGYGGGDAS